MRLEVIGVMRLAVLGAIAPVCLFADEWNDVDIRQVPVTQVRVEAVKGEAASLLPPDKKWKLVWHDEQFVLISTEPGGYRRIGNDGGLSAGRRTWGKPDPRLFDVALPDFFEVDFVRVYDAEDVKEK